MDLLTVVLPPSTNEITFNTLDDIINNPRIKLLSIGFIFMVSSFGVTGAKDNFDKYQIDYFKRIKKMDLLNSLLIGFGISNNKTFKSACENSSGAIIGSAFINHLENYGVSKTNDFIKKIKT